ncbi:MAG: tetratricopeptide repeat protein [Bacteroidota bacterium]|nr:tetratricopeptide repeat protein [Bacteroidota bacterium]
MFKTKAIAFMLLLVVFNSYAGNTKKIDSLYTVLKASQNDTTKINLRLKIAGLLIKDDSVKGEHEVKIVFASLNSLADKVFAYKSIEKIGKLFYNNGMNKKARYYWDFGLEKTKLEKNSEWQSRFYFRIADYYQREELSRQSTAYFDSALALAKGVNEKLLCEILMKKGRAHYDNGDYKLAMTDYIEAQRLFEKNNWKNSEYGQLMHFIGSVFKRQGFYDKALNYYEKELNLARSLKDRAVEAEALYLCAAMYGSQGKLDKEFEFEKKALDIYIELKNVKSQALMYGNIAYNYLDRKDYQGAIKSAETAIEKYKEAGAEERSSDIYELLGNIYLQMDQPKKAIVYLNKAMEYAMKIETKQLLNRSGITKSLAFAYSDIGDYKKAFDYILEYQKLNDSLSNQSNVEYLSNLEKQYDTEKKEKEIALLSKDKKIQEEEILRQTNQRRSLIVVIILVLIAAGVSLFAFINKRKTSKLLSKQVDEINYQNAVIKEKNKDITDSIQYAKRLQEAVFPETDRLNHFFAESFVLFRPKDIVSGDFYWFEEVENKAFLVVGDCTGHGVPGAFMSILGHNLLNQIILEEKIVAPSQILRMLDIRVSNALNKKGNREENNDGMDIIVCVIDKRSGKLQYSGANRPLLIKRGDKLIDLKPNKHSIGGIQSDTVKIFMQQEIELKLEDALYLFSDGYADQFGGPKGKKFKYKQLTEFILNIGSKPFKDQKTILLDTLETWKGNLEQVDDVCIIGVKI